MRTWIAVGIGLVLGVAGATAALYPRLRVAGDVSVWIARSAADAQVLVGREAARALAAEHPDALRDFANYAVDSGLLAVRLGATAGTYDAALAEAVRPLPPARRALSAVATPLQRSARSALEGLAP